MAIFAIRLAASCITLKGPASSSLSLLVCSLCRSNQVSQQPSSEIRRNTTTHLLIEDEATEQRSHLLRRQIVKDTVEDHLGQQQLISRADLARDTTLLLDDIIVGGEAESTERTLAVLELVEVHDRVRGLDLLLDGADLSLESLLGRVLLVEGGEVGVRVQRVGHEAGFENLDFLCEGRSKVRKAS